MTELFARNGLRGFVTRQRIQFSRRNPIAPKPNAIAGIARNSHYPLASRGSSAITLLADKLMMELIYRPFDAQCEFAHTYGSVTHTPVGLPTRWRPCATCLLAASANTHRLTVGPLLHQLVGQLGVGVFIIANRCFLCDRVFLRGELRTREGRSLLFAHLPRKWL